MKGGFYVLFRIAQDHDEKRCDLPDGLTLQEAEDITWRIAAQANGATLYVGDDKTEHHCDMPIFDIQRWDDGQLHGDRIRPVVESETRSRWVTQC